MGLFASLLLPAVGGWIGSQLFGSGGSSAPAAPAAPSPAQGLYQPPEPRNLAQEMREQLSTQIELAPQLFAAEQQFAPQYAGLQQSIYEDVLGDQLGFYESTVQPATSRIQAAAATSQRGADIADVERFGPRAVEAMRESMPEYYEMLAELRAESEEGIGTEISAELGRQALEELLAGADLTPEERRRAIQDSRGAWESRGLLMTRPAAAEETLNLYGLGEQRQAQRRGFAMDVENLQTQQAESNRAFRGNVASMYGSSGADPYALVLGRPPTNQSFGQGQQQFAGQFTGAGPGLFNPASGYGSNLYAQNASQAGNVWGTQVGQQADISMTGYNAQIAQQIAAANARADIFGGALGGIGAAVGGWLGRP